ncbi:hypothetical protein U0070_001777 [Myodes glareolus]|uniref:Uncharacterized protein n=1 Tax=Myodes glareolus TaxID=447135 RepID=A0AAW0HLY7_MYOGA
MAPSLRCPTMAAPLTPALAIRHRPSLTAEGPAGCSREGSMDLPVDEWISYLLDKWASFPKSVQDTVSTAETLSDIFLCSSSLLQ